MAVRCLPVTSIIGLILIVLGFLIVDVYYLFWIGFSLLIIVIITLISIVYFDRISPWIIYNNSINNNNHGISLYPFKKENTDTVFSDKINTSFGHTYVKQIKLKNNNNNNNELYDVIFIHGLTTFNEWEYTIKKLINKESNFINSIITYHLYGRGSSDASLNLNTLQYFITQLSDILIQLNINNKLILFGMSQGGAIATGFTNIFKNRVHKLILIAPAGLPVKKPILAHIGIIPPIDTLISPLLYKNEMNKAIQNDFYDLNNIESKMLCNEMINDTNEMYIKSKYSQKCIMSTIKYFPLGEMKPIFDELFYHNNNEFQSKTMFIWGKNDETCPSKNRELYPNIKVFLLDKCAHNDTIASYSVDKWFNDVYNFLKE